VESLVESLLPYLEFSRVGFVNILAFRLRYFTGIITYFLNVTVYYFIWTAVFHSSAHVKGYTLAQIITYVSVGWIIRSFYWNTIDQEMAYEVIEGKIAMDFIRPVSIQWMWISRAMGESAFRLILLTLPTAVVIALIFPVQGPSSRENFLLFLIGVLGSFFLMGAINFMIGTCAIPLKSILALIRAKYWLIEAALWPADPDQLFSVEFSEGDGLAPVRAHRLHTPPDLSGQAEPGSGCARTARAVDMGGRAARAGEFVVEPRIAENHDPRRIASRGGVSLSRMA